MNDNTKLRRGWFFEEDQPVEAEAWLNDLGQQGWQLEYVGFWNAVFKTSGSSVMRYACVKQALYRTYEAEDNAKETFEKAGWKYIDCHKGMFVFCAPVGTARPELPAGYVTPKPFLAKAQPWIDVIVQFAVAVFFVLFFVGETATGKLADILLHSELWMFIMLCCCGICIAQSVIELRMTLRMRRAAEEPTENNDSDVPSYRKTYVRNRANRVLGIALPILFAFTKSFFPFTTTTQPPASEHMAQISVSDIMKTKSETGTYEYSVSHSFLYPQQMVMWEYQGESDARYHFHGDAALHFEEYHALMPCLAALLADELAKYDPADVDEHNQLQPSGDKLGFDRLWYSSAVSDAMLLAQKGDNVYLLKIDQPASQGDMAAALNAKIEQAKGP